MMLRRLIITIGSAHLLISLLVTVNTVHAIGDLGELLILTRLLGGGAGGARTFGCHQARQTASGGPGGIDGQPNTLNEVGYVDTNFGAAGSSYPGDARAVLLNRHEPMPIKQAAGSSIVSESIIPGLMDVSTVERQDPATLAKLTSNNADASSDVSYISAVSTGGSAGGRTSHKVEISASLWDASPTAAEENWAHSVPPSHERSKKKTNIFSTTSTTRRPELTKKVPPKAPKPVIKVSTPDLSLGIVSNRKFTVSTTTAATPLVSASENSKVAKLLTKLLHKPAAVAAPANLRHTSSSSGGVQDEVYSAVTGGRMTGSSKRQHTDSAVSDASSFWSFRRRKRQIILGGGDTGIKMNKRY